VSSFWRTLSVRLVILGAIIVIVSFIALLLLVTLPLLALVLNLAACISAADDVTQVTVVFVAPTTVLLRWSDAAGRVPMGTVPVVIFVTLIFVLLAVDRIRYSCCI
jgi:hypothetical protein